MPSSLTSPPRPPAATAAPPPAAAPRLFLLVGGSQPAGPERRRRRAASLGASLGLQMVLGGLILAALALRPPEARLRPLPLQPLADLVLHYPAAAAPPPEAILPPRRRAPPPPRLPPPRLTRPAPAPAAVAPAPEPKPPTPVAASASAPPLPARRPAPAPRHQPRVELGRFGQPDGVLPQPAAPLPVPQLGSFGQAAAGPPPAGPAAPGDLGRSGFAAAAPDATPGAALGAVLTGGFAPPGATAAPPSGAASELALGAFPAPRPVATRAPAPAAAPPEFEPARVLALPRPVYTPAALRQRLEGEVVLEVRLRADGQAEVLRVERGLGFGLDQAAAAAARRLQFRPARRRGIAVDSTVVVRVQFRLAY